MSIESVHQMIETAKNDAALKKQLQTAERPENVLAIASERGYEFTEKELLIVMQERQLSCGEELSEEELESVAGGGPKVLGFDLGNLDDIDLGDVSLSDVQGTLNIDSHNENKRVGNVGGKVGGVS